MSPAELNGPELDGEIEAVTAGGSAPDSDRHPIDVAHRSLTGNGTHAGAGPNGWFAGPHADPDRFELLGPGLVGGEGNTWRARYRGELAAPLTVAVKELRRPRQAPDQWPTPTDVRRWEDQRALLQYMRIDHLVSVIDIFVGPPPHPAGPGLRRTPDTPYVVMEWVPGPTLADELSGEAATSATLPTRLTHVQHVARALHALHSQTISAGNPSLHRDVKPTNCIVDPHRGVVLVDVGTMRRMDDGYDQDGRHTPAYTAPEVLAHPQAARTAATDLYSLGALAYFCVLGEDPPTANQPGSTEPVRARLLAAATSAQVADAPGFVDHLQLMLQARPEQRPADARAWARRLTTLAAVRTRRLVPARLSRTAVRVAIGVLMLAAIVAVGVVRLVGLGSSSANPSGAIPFSQSSVRSGDPASPPPGLPPGPPPSGFGPPPTGARPSGTPGRLPGPEAAIRSNLAAFVSPRGGGTIGPCVLIEGTSHLPAGRTLMLSVINLSVGDQVRHISLIPGWQEPATLAHWGSPQPVGLPGDPAGERYLVEIVDVPLAALQKEVTAGGPPSVPATSLLAASLLVSRSNRPDSAGCQRPPPEVRGISSSTVT